MLFNMILPGAVETARLPKEYQEVEYIQSSGTQYIDTGFKPNQDTRVVCRGICVIDGTNWLFGTRISGNSQSFGFAASTSGYYLAFYNTGSKAFATSFNSAGIIEVDNNKGITTLISNGVTGSVTGVSGTFTSDYNLVLFGVNTGGTITRGEVTIYSCQICDNGTLIRDFVPCCRKADGAKGLYDLIGKAFYANAGTGAFAAGPAVDNAPSTGELFEFTYSGNYTDNRINGKGTVRLNTSGTLTVFRGQVTIQVYVLGGGGGGAYTAAGQTSSAGGSGGYQTVEVTLAPGVYAIIIGVGGKGAKQTNSNYNIDADDGGSTSAFGYISTGGEGGVTNARRGGAGGTPNGEDGGYAKSSSGTTVAGGSPNGGSVVKATPSAGGDGYVELTFI